MPSGRRKNTVTSAMLGSTKRKPIHCGWPRWRGRLRKRPASGRVEPLMLPTTEAIPTCSSLHQPSRVGRCSPASADPNSGRTVSLAYEAGLLLESLIQYRLEALLGVRNGAIHVVGEDRLLHQQAPGRVGAADDAVVGDRVRRAGVALR